MKTIKVSRVKDEVIAFLDHKANELSKISKRNISRNAYVNLILEKQLRDDLSLDDKYDEINMRIDLLIEVLKENKQETERLISLIVYGDDE